MCFMTIGTVKWFNNIKGWGFIDPKIEGPEIFVHFSSIQATGFRTLAEGQTVAFDVDRSEKGLHANNVVILNSDESVVIKEAIE